MAKKKFKPNLVPLSYKEGVDLATSIKAALYANPGLKSYNYKHYKVLTRSECKRTILLNTTAQCSSCKTVVKHFKLEELPPAIGHPGTAYAFRSYGVLNGKEVFMTVDHIIPKSKGGPNESWNLQNMCSYCNNFKGNDTSKIDWWDLAHRMAKA